jgi:hypothetical protein
MNGCSLLSRCDVGGEAIYLNARAYSANQNKKFIRNKERHRRKLIVNEKNNKKWRRREGIIITV